MSTRSLCSPGATKNWHIPKPQSLTRGFFLHQFKIPISWMVNDGQVPFFFCRLQAFFRDLLELLKPLFTCELKQQPRYVADTGWDHGMEQGAEYHGVTKIDRVRVADSGSSYMSAICLLYSICLLLQKGTVLSVKFNCLSPWGRDCEPADIAFWKWFGTEGILRIQPWVMQGVVMAVCWCKSTISSAKALWGANTSRSRAGKGFCWIHHAIWSV